MSFDELMQHAAEIESKAIEVELANTNTRRRAEGNERGYEAHREVIERKYLNTIVPLFEPYSRIPDPADYDGIIGDLAGAVGDLSNGHMTDPMDSRPVPANPKLTQVEEASDELQDWTGEAADAFKCNFLDPFPAISVNQFILVSTLKGALQAHKTLWESPRRDIDDIAHGAITALDNVDGCGKNEVNFTFNVVSAVGAIIAIPLTGGASAGVAVLAAIGSTGAAAVAGADAMAGGGSAEQVVQSTKDAIEKLATKIREAEDKIAKVLSDNVGVVAQTKQFFVSRRPALAGMQGKELTSEEGLGQAE